MKSYIVALLLLLHIPGRASQIVVGLRSENLVSWSVWEREGTALKHYLLLYNKAPQELDIRVKLRRFKAVDTNFEEVKTEKTLLRLRLGAHKLVRLRYPKNASRYDFLEYFENGQSIGLTQFNTTRPPAIALLNARNRFFSVESINGGIPTHWVEMESIYTMPAQIEVTTANSNFYGGHELVKLYPTLEAAQQQAGTLDSAAIADNSIIRLDSAHRSAVLSVPPNFSTPDLTVLVLQTERVEFITRYDENKLKVREKSVAGGAIYFLPIFHGKRE